MGPALLVRVFLPWRDRCQPNRRPGSFDSRIALVTSVWGRVDVIATMCRAI